MKKINYLIPFLISIGAILLPLPSKAFIPYIYEPEAKNLEKTGLSIAKSAAKLLQIGQPKEAARIGSLAVRLNPKDFRIWLILAEAQIKSENIEQANQSLAKAKKLNPKNAGIWFTEASLALQEKKTKTAIKLLEKGLSLQPDNAGGYFQLGNAKIIEGKLYLALEDFKKSVSLKPNFWEALNNQGLILFEINQIKKAIKTWRKVLEIQVNAEPMLALASALYISSPDKKEAIQLAIEALEKDPNYVSSIYQKEQLWGDKLIKANKQLFKEASLKPAIEKAKSNATVKLVSNK